MSKKYKVEAEYKIKSHSFDTDNIVMAKDRDDSISKITEHLKKIGASDIKIKHSVLV
jgi:hypothetical protein